MSEPLEVKSDHADRVQLTGTPVSEGDLVEVDATILLADLERLGLELRQVIVRTKRVRHMEKFDPHEDSGRSLALAQSHLQTGFMWLRRAIKPMKGF